MVSKIVCIMTIVGLTSGAVWQERRLPKKPQEHAHKEGCYIEQLDDVIPFGEIVTPIGDCYSIECTRHTIEYASCGLVTTEDCFVTETDVSQPYPHCCPNVKCEVDNYLI